MRSSEADIFRSWVTGDLSGRLSLRRAQFLNDDEEQRFQSWQFAGLRSIMNFGLGVLGLIALTNLLLDLHSQVSGPILLLRMLLFVAVALACLLLWTDSPLMRAQRVIECYTVFLLTVGGWLLLTHARYHFIGPVSQIGATFVVYLLVPIPWTRQTLYALLYSGIGMLGWAHKLGASDDVVRIGLWLLFANALGAYFAYQRHLYERRLFSAGNALAHQLETEQEIRRQHAFLVDLLTHELRNPLAAIGAQAEWIQRTVSDARTRQVADHIRGSSERSARLIEQWVHGDRMVVASALPTDAPMHPRSWLDGVFADVRHRYPELRLELPIHPLPEVLMAPHVLAVAVSNILDNAAKYAPSPLGVRVQYRISRRWVGIRIRDFGPGIDFADQERIFLKHQRLQMASDRPTGTGVGLYLVQAMLQRCGGRIRVQSQPGRGSAFIIEVPRA